MLLNCNVFEYFWHFLFFFALRTQKNGQLFGLKHLAFYISAFSNFFLAFSAHISSKKLFARLLMGYPSWRKFKIRLFHGQFYSRSTRILVTSTKHVLAWHSQINLELVRNWRIPTRVVVWCPCETLPPRASMDPAWIERQDEYPRWDSKAKEWNWSCIARLVPDPGI